NDASERVYLRDGAASGAYFDHFDDGNANGKPAAAHESRGAADLESTRRLGFTLVDQTKLRRRATHIEGDELINTVLLRDSARKHGAAARTGFHQTHRKPGRRVNCGHATAGRHDQQRTVQAFLAQAFG